MIDSTKRRVKKVALKEYPMAWGDRLRSRLLNLNKSQFDLATGAEISRSSVDRALRNVKGLVGAPILFKIEKYLQTYEALNNNTTPFQQSVKSHTMKISDLECRKISEFSTDELVKELIKRNLTVTLSTPSRLMRKL